MFKHKTLINNNESKFNPKQEMYRYITDNFIILQFLCSAVMYFCRQLGVSYQ